MTWAPAVDAAIAENISKPGALLPILHAVQHKVGYVPEESVPVIAEALNLSRAEVHGVVSFYHEFRTSPPGRHMVHVCRAEACQSMNAEALVEHVKARLGIDFHGTTVDGSITLEPIYCLGNCALSPAILVDGELHGRMTPHRFNELAAELEVSR